MKLTNKRTGAAGFSLMELLLVIIIMGVLLAVLSPQITGMVRSAQETTTKGNLSSMRSALTMYYGDNAGIYPSDTLASLTANNGKYMQSLPMAKTPSYHTDSNGVVNSTSDASGWVYDNNTAHTTYGTIWVNCTHTDSHSTTWTQY